ncbi:hypothetical protein KCU78_g1430, partial [Aureobasidium melanogenum]
MPHLCHDKFFPRGEGLEFLSRDDLEEAFIMNEDEQFWLIREYGEPNNRIDSPEARQIFNSDHTVNPSMLCLKREILSKINQLVDNWNVYIDLCEFDMSMEMSRGDMTIEQASQRRHNNELDSDQLMQNVHEPPEEYHRILNQFRAWRNWSPIHEPQPEQIDPLTDSTGSTLDLVSPFREPNVFDYLDVPSTTTSPRPDLNNYFFISVFLGFDPTIGREDVERYLALEPTIQNRDFEQETQDIQNEIQDIVARHQILVEKNRSLIDLGDRDTSVGNRYQLIQVLAQVKEAVTDVLEVFESYKKIRGIQLCRQVLVGNISRLEANRQYELYSAYSGALDECWMEVHNYHRDAERLDYLFPRHGNEEHERLTTLPTINTHLAGETVITPMGYTLTEEDFLEDVEEHSPDAHEWDFHERLRDLQTEEREASTKYQALLEEQQSLVQHGYHNTSILYRHRYIWVCEEIWEAVHDTDEAWRKFTKLQDLELREKLRAREITIEQIERIRDETQHQRDTLTIRWMQAGIACIEAKRLVGFHAVAEHEATRANTNLFTSIVAFLTRLHRIISGALGL